MSSGIDDPGIQAIWQELRTLRTQVDQILNFTANSLDLMGRTNRTVFQVFENRIKELETKLPGSTAP